MKSIHVVAVICCLPLIAFSEPGDTPPDAPEMDPFEISPATSGEEEDHDPFSAIEDIELAPDYSMPVDRGRGSFTLLAKDGTYMPGSHFANWSWSMTADRSGHYYVGLIYRSNRPKLGIQIRVGTQAVLKGYAPRTHALRQQDPLILGTALLPEPGEYPVMMLTGDQSNVPAFQVEGIKFIPAPESEPLGQSIDGSITLEAKTATTYAESMRYEPQETKNCLGFWREKDDWAEWKFDINAPGDFNVSLHYGCGNGNEGSEVAVLVNDQVFKFSVEDTGGFQSWKALDLGTVSLSQNGGHKVAIIPLSKAGKSVMDVSKVTLTPRP
ncbi:MAG: hypothetical protein AAGA96_20290 [Verrucomicrobiota bacterium]